MFNFLCCHSEDLEAQRQAASSAARSSADDAVFQWVHMPCWVKCNPDGTPVEPLQARLQHPATVLDARPKALGHFFISTNTQLRKFTAPHYCSTTTEIITFHHNPQQLDTRNPTVQQFHNPTFAQLVCQLPNKTNTKSMSIQFNNSISSQLHRSTALHFHNTLSDSSTSSIFASPLNIRRPASLQFYSAATPELHSPTFTHPHSHTVTQLNSTTTH